MTYIDWLLSKLAEELNFDGPDVFEILLALFRCASATMKTRIATVLNLMSKNYYSDALKNYIRTAILLDQNTIPTDQRAKRLERAEFFLICDLFMWYIKNLH